MGDSGSPYTGRLNPPHSKPETPVTIVSGGGQWRYASFTNSDLPGGAAILSAGPPAPVLSGLHWWLHRDWTCTLYMQRAFIHHLMKAGLENISPWISGGNKGVDKNLEGNCWMLILQDPGSDVSIGSAWTRHNVPLSCRPTLPQCLRSELSVLNCKERH